MVTIDDMLVDAFTTEMLKDFVDAVNTVQNSLRWREQIIMVSDDNSKPIKNYFVNLRTN